MLTIRLIGIGAAIAILLVAAGNSGQVGLSQGQPVRTLTGHTWGVKSVAFSPDGRLLASGSGGRAQIKLWEVATGEKCAPSRATPATVYSVAFTDCHSGRSAPRAPPGLRLLWTLRIW
jgi:WD40 repeat protein